jgi:hypothetical protein
MQSTLSADADGARLRASVQPAIAASANDAALAVELELISILDGPAFHGSARSRAFLRFVVEEALVAGRQEMLKERTVGVAVLGKPSDYDTEPIPRSECAPMRCANGWRRTTARWRRRLEFASNCRSEPMLRDSQRWA